MLFFEELNRPLRITVPLALGIILAAAALLIIKMSTSSTKIPLSIFLFAATAACFFTVLSGASAEKNIPWSGLPLSQVESFTVTAGSDSRRTAKGGFILSAELAETVSGTTRTSAGGSILLFFNFDPKIYKGERLIVEAPLSPGPDYETLLAEQTIGIKSMVKYPEIFVSYAKTEEIIRVGWNSSAAKMRAHMMGAIKGRCALMGDGPGGLFLALLTGYRDGLSAEESRIFREAGCSHILALSGMHLGILSVLILFILKPLPGRKPAFFISCFIILCYLFLTGFGISLVRAAVMYFLYGLNSAFYRKSRGIDVLILSFVIVTAASPSAFYTLSFQLSFLAVGGMLIAAPAFEHLFKSWLPAIVRTPLAFSAGAQLPVIPLLMLSFGVIYPVGLAAGIIIAPMVTLFIWTGLVFLATDIGAVSFFTDLVYKAVYKAADAASRAPSVRYEQSAWQTALIISGVAAILVISSIRRRNFHGVSGKLRFPR